MFPINRTDADKCVCPVRIISMMSRFIDSFPPPLRISFSFDVSWAIFYERDVPFFCWRIVKQHFRLDSSAQDVVLGKFSNEIVIDKTSPIVTQLSNDILSPSIPRPRNLVFFAWLLNFRTFVRFLLRMCSLIMFVAYELSASFRIGLSLFWALHFVPYALCSTLSLVRSTSGQIAKVSSLL